MKLVNSATSPRSDQGSGRACTCGATPRRPPFLREVIVTAPAVFALILIVGTIGKPLLSTLPELAATAATVAAVVTLLTWPVMPLLSRILHRFLYPQPEARSSRT